MLNLNLIRLLSLSMFYLVTFCALISYSEAETLTLRADSWYPYNGDPKSETPGFIIEIARAVFAESGIKIDYQLMPWARAIKEADNGKINGIVGAAHGDVPNFVFPSEAVGLSRYAFFTLPSNSWTYSDLASLSTATVGYISDYSYGKTFDDFRNASGKGNKRLVANSGDKALEQLIKMLQLGRIDAVISSPEVFSWTVNSLGLKQDQFRLAGTPPETDEIYIAFSPKLPTSKKYAEILAAGVKKLRSNGELAKILARYNTKDWK